MDPTTDEQLDYGDEEYGGNHKMQYHGSGGTIPALAEDEMMGEDDEYDDLYNDVNVGEGFLQLQQRSDGQPGPPTSAGNGNFQAAKPSFPDGIRSEEAKVPGVVTEGKYGGTEIRFPEQKSGPGPVVERGTVDAGQNGRPLSMTLTHDGNSGYQGSVPMAQKTGPVQDPINFPPKNANEATPLVNSGSRVVPPHMQINQNMNSPIISEAPPVRPPLENNGNTMLFVGELHWWTTDAELESMLMQYGNVKEIKFFDERASGKSKGYCQVEFFDSSSAAACKEGMNGHMFNGRACAVAFATPQTIKQMGSSYMNKTQNQVQPSQPQQGGRRPMNEGGVGRGAANYNNAPGGDAGAGRNFGRGNWGRGGPGMQSRGPGGGSIRGRGPMGSKNNMMGNLGAGAGGAFGQGLVGGPAFGGPHAGLMHPQGMMGPSFDPGFMGRGAGYGGFPGPAFPGMIPQFPGVNPMGLHGVAPHVNPAFFGRGMAANGMGMMGNSGMDGPHPGMWSDTSGGGWGGGGEEHGRRTRESSYGGEDNASEYGGYGGEVSHDKGAAKSSAVSREKERGSEHSEKRHRDEREHDRERYDNSRDHHRSRENERDSYRDYRHKERDTDYEDDYDRGQSSRSRSRSRAAQEEDHHRSSRSRDTNYGKRRRAPSE